MNIRGFKTAFILSCTSLIVVRFKIGAITPKSDSCGVFCVPIRINPSASGFNFNVIWDRIII